MKNYSKYVGKKWEYKTNDCIAVVKLILFELFNIKVHEIKLPEQSSFAYICPIFEAEANSEKWVKVDKAREGVAALFYNRKDQPFHIGLCVDERSVIHCPGTPKQPGYTQIERLKDLPPLIYKRVEFYAYNCS